MISLIIPTHNAESYLLELFKAIKRQKFTDYELIVIDSSSKDKTVEMAKGVADIVKVIPQNEFDHGGTRDIAANLASGEILLFLTQDAIPANEDTFENIVQVFKNQDVTAAYGRQLNYPDTNLFGQHLRLFNYPSKTEIRSAEDISRLGIKTAQLSNSFSAYRKSTFDELDGFKTNLILGEDVYLGGKMILEGYKLAYVGNAKVYHSHSYTIKEEFKRYFDIGVFHRNEKWLLDAFGKAEGEGLAYVKSEIRFLFTKSAYCQLIQFFPRTLAKYTGYKLGYHHNKLPSLFIKKCSMHWRWWNKQ